MPNIVAVFAQKVKEQIYLLAQLGQSSRLGPRAATARVVGDGAEQTVEGPNAAVVESPSPRFYSLYPSAVYKKARAWKEQIGRAHV